VAARIPEFIRKLRVSQSAGEAYSLIEEPDPFGACGAHKQ
jgi:hypothetical protein